jgi:hypothetical protein
VFRAPRGPHYAVADTQGRLAFSAARSLSLMDGELKAQVSALPDAPLGAAALRRLAGRVVSVRAVASGQTTATEIGCGVFTRL